mgnify:CR=1 FL=1
MYILNMNSIHLSKQLPASTIGKAWIRWIILQPQKEDILAASRELIKESGWTAVSIRAVASRCSVSAGTIYNYYESKADLLGDTIESIWREIFFRSEDEQVFKDVAACISWIYKRLEYGNEQFPGFFSLHSFGFMKDEKTDGKKKMLQTWGHILHELCVIVKEWSQDSFRCIWSAIHRKAVCRYIIFFNISINDSSGLWSVCDIDVDQ